ncbi:thiol-disulfide oxidoreductase DCC family protein [Neobacillus sp. OS1-33]|jgi:predicted DCC family thiol-disulfide oxidoreductase YuxK|uniref:thiol-disulfide oxidoreductase DCC family protein n=1 Tax=Neobacillus sp. OS1-33 TaxID=3070683 RepID=UPI0027DFE059|nr:thiol-disulfide oxidoreductase DCC family protein [Neobacillus sp. OS1-33]WML26672.1 thiol-disulfide oxidoreductase DCC family protein [Neobacillus sp. OS1-33]
MVKLGQYKIISKAGVTLDRIILFDGVCNLCNTSVKFIIKRDSEGQFKFASLQSETGQTLLRMHGLNKDLNSFVLLEDDKVYLKSSAALRVCRKLGSAWPALSLFRFLPPFIRDLLYDFVAKNRYKWFGKEESCLVPSPEWKQRFLD